MRPITVVMSAFGSYAGVETISFEECNHGLFLITGDTGAGKTTIFDAITYALYDQTSGGKRDGDMMRSQYATEDIPTFVQLTFSYHDKIFTIKRNPNYQRISKRRNKDGEYGTTQESASVELIMPDGKPFRGKVKETNKKIEEIIGLDINQFTQIVMIAQGDFLKLLHAPSRDRKEIFAKIFDTKLYGKIQEELKNRAKNIDFELRKNKDNCIREMNDIRCMKESPFEEEWKEMPQFSEVNPDRILELLKHINEEIRQKENEILGQIENTRKQLYDIKSSITSAETINAIFDELLKTIRAKENLENQKERFEKIRVENLRSKKALKVWQKESIYLKKEEELRDTLERIVAIKKEIINLSLALDDLWKEKDKKEQVLQEKNKEITPTITRILDSMQRYEELTQMQNKESSAKKELENVENILLKIEKEISCNKQKMDKLLVDQEELKDSEKDYLELGQKVKALEEKKKSLGEMLAAKKRLESIITELTKSTMKVEKLLIDYNNKSAEYDKLNQDFINEQVGIIAKGLEKGTPCPVCGSIEHPKKAKLSSKSVTQKAVDEAKKVRDEADLKLQIAKENHAEIKRGYEKEHDYIEYEGRRIIEENFKADETGLTQIDSIVLSCNTEFEAKKKLWIEVEKKNKRYESNKKIEKELEKEAISLRDKKEATTKAWQDVKSKYEILTTEIKALKKNLPYETEKEANENLKNLQKQMDKLEKETKEAKDAYQNQVSAIEKKQAAQTTEETAKERQEVEKEECFNRFHFTLQEEGFEDISSYQSARVEEKVIEERDREYQEYYESYLKISENVKTYAEQTKGKERIEIEGLIKREEQLSDNYKALSTESKVVFNIKEGNERATQTLSKLFKERAKKKAEFEIMSRLDKTANGSLSGSVKLDFQTYMQRRYFEHIIHEANKRLIVMSSNQFILQCRNLKDLGTQGEVGLDLDVYSMVTDKTRDVKTLSGGESFMASLSMALGMADVIQNTAGKIHMDTMFIDEGFGSLDEDTREEAIKILNGLAEGKRLVGIISHVTELKERINRKLLVRKDENGSSIKWES